MRVFHQEEDNYNIVFSLTSGQVTVCDKRSERNEYKACIAGDLQMNSVTVVRGMMQAIEETLQLEGVEKFVCTCQKKY